MHPNVAVAADNEFVPRQSLGLRDIETSVMAADEAVASFQIVPRRAIDADGSATARYYLRERITPANGR